MTDLHAHILPMMDDGPQDLGESVAMLRLLAKVGFDRIFLTPHFRTGLFDNTPSRVRAATQMLRCFLEDAGLAVHLVPSQEVHLDSVLDSHGELRDLLTFGAGERHLLLELPRQPFPFDLLLRTVAQLSRAGIRTVLAHPERHPDLCDSVARRRQVLDRGVRFQVNLTSLSGLSGPRAQKAAETLCREGFVSAFGTDAHSYQDVRAYVPRGLQRAARLMGDGALRAAVMAPEFRFDSGERVPGGVGASRAPAAGGGPRGAE